MSEAKSAEGDDLPERVVVARGGLSTAYHRPDRDASPDDPQPACHATTTREFRFRRREGMSDMSLSACDYCFGDSSLGPESSPGDDACPFCGRSVYNLPNHLLDCPEAPREVEHQ